jgi:hypothetical protein
VWGGGGGGGVGGGGVDPGDCVCINTAGKLGCGQSGRQLPAIMLRTDGVSAHCCCLPGGVVGHPPKPTTPDEGTWRIVLCTCTIHQELQAQGGGANRRMGRRAPCKQGWGQSV